MNVNYMPLNGNKMFAIIDSYGYVTDCWLAETIEEAQADNPDKKVIEVTLENSPFSYGKKYDKEISE